MSTYVTTLDTRITSADCGADPDADEQMRDFCRDHFAKSLRAQAEAERDLDPAVRDAIDAERAVRVTVGMAAIREQDDGLRAARLERSA